MERKFCVYAGRFFSLRDRLKKAYGLQKTGFSMLFALWALSLFVTSPPVQAAESAVIKVFKSATCGCCTKWVDHLRAAGFTVEATDRDDMARLKRENGISEQIESCHTAFVAGYFIEGHVPAQDVKRLLAERPKIVGLAVPEMPVGSPGMEGRNPVVYDVLAVDAQGKTTVYATHRPKPAH